MEKIKKYVGIVIGLLLNLLKLGLIVGIIGGVITGDWHLVIGYGVLIAIVVFAFRFVSNELARLSIYVPFPEFFGISSELREKGQQIQKDLIGYNPFGKN